MTVKIVILVQCRMLQLYIVLHYMCFTLKCFFSSPSLVCSLSLQASRECQSKEKLLEQGFRSAFREFQQWLVNAKINTAKCFDVPQNINEASSSLQKIQVQDTTSVAMAHSITGLIATESTNTVLHNAA